MSKTLAPLLLAALLSATTVAAQTVTVDFDASVEFGGFKTFAWQATPETSLEQSSPLMHQRIVKAIESQLLRSGIQQVESDADILVTYHTETEEKLHVVTSDYGYGYPRDWYRYGSSASYRQDTTVTSYTEGTLIIDVWSPATKTLIWRATATAVVPEKPETAAKKIDGAVDKICAKWEKMKSKGKVRLVGQ